MAGRAGNARRSRPLLERMPPQCRRAWPAAGRPWASPAAPDHRSWHKAAALAGRIAAQRPLATSLGPGAVRSQTLSNLLRVSALALLLVKAFGDHSGVTEISLKSMQCYCAVSTLRLSSILFYEGYLPFDSSGDWFYQSMEVFSLILAGALVFTMTMSNKRHGYNPRNDVFGKDFSIGPLTLPSNLGALWLIVPSIVVAMVSPGPSKHSLVAARAPAICHRLAGGLVRSACPPAAMLPRSCPPKPVALPAALPPNAEQQLRDRRRLVCCPVPGGCGHSSPGSHVPPRIPPARAHFAVRLHDRHVRPLQPRLLALLLQRAQRLLLLPLWPFLPGLRRGGLPVPQPGHHVRLHPSLRPGCYCGPSAHPPLLSGLLAPRALVQAAGVGCRVKRGDSFGRARQSSGAPDAVPLTLGP